MIICVKKEGKIERHIITETEAYMGPHDLACHASKGRTKRTETLYSEAGTIYVYLIYGMYELLNVVTSRKEYPAAVLIRGVGPYDGPGKLTRGLGITRSLNGRKLGRMTGLWIEEPKKETTVRIHRTPRIGVGYAKEWAKKRLRFVLTSSS